MIFVTGAPGNVGKEVISCQVGVIYVPFLQRAFDIPLHAHDWLRELSKAVRRSLARFR